MAIDKKPKQYAKPNKKLKYIKLKALLLLL